MTPRATLGVPPRAGSGDAVAAASRIGAEVAAEAAPAVDRDARFPAEAFDALRAEGLLSVLIPAECGGAGASVDQVARMTEELGRHCASTGLIFAMHQIQVACLVRHGRSAWVRGFLRDVASQQLLLASATTETGVGGDVRSSICALERSGDTFQLAKDAPVISYGAHADAILATARRDAESPANDQVLVVIPRAQATLEWRSGWDTMGFRGTCSDGFLLTATGSADQVLSDPYAEISATTMLPVSHILWASVWLGIATGATDIAHTHVRQEARRKPGTTPPAALRLAELLTVYDQLRALVRGAAEDYARALDTDEVHTMGFAVRMNSLKTAASSLVVDVVGRALTTCGIAAYREDSPLSLSRQLRDAYGAVLMINNDRILGTTAQMLLVHRGDR